MASIFYHFSGVYTLTEYHIARVGYVFYEGFFFCIWLISDHGNSKTRRVVDMVLVF